MATQELIDGQFDRAVEIVQSLPKTGPIQTSYEEKLTMYSLYKQATVGNVKNPRPGIWDVLGRAKWDAWAKHKDLNPYEAKWLYVDALLKVLRKYSDKTAARSMVQELESFGGDPSNLVLSRSLSRSRDSVSSGSTASDGPAGSPHGLLPRLVIDPAVNSPQSDDDIIASEDDEPSQMHESPVAPDRSWQGRSQSSLSSHRYRTPVGSHSIISPSPMQLEVPAVQPHPGFETPSAFSDNPTLTVPSRYSPAAQSVYSRRYSTPSQQPYLSAPPYRGHSQPLPERYYANPPIQPHLRNPLEVAIENVEAHLAALSERIEVLEALSRNSRRSSASPRWGPNSPNARLDGHDEHEWDLGMWSIAITPFLRAFSLLRRFGLIIARSEHRSAEVMVIRRLLLDLSFLICVAGGSRILWKWSGVRRREVNAALVALIHAVVGTRRRRRLIDRGI